MTDFTANVAGSVVAGVCDDDDGTETDYTTDLTDDDTGTCPFKLNKSNAQLKCTFNESNIKRTDLAVGDEIIIDFGNLHNGPLSIVCLAYIDGNTPTQTGGIDATVSSTGQTITFVLTQAWIDELDSATEDWSFRVAESCVSPAAGSDAQCCEVRTNLAGPSSGPDPNAFIKPVTNTLLRM